MPKVHINGIEVEVAEGTKLIDVFLQNNEDIAHYCYHPGLSVAGVCRLCMVEIEGNPRPQIACNTVVQDGMKVTNKSESIKEGVKWVLDFHLINHPLDCPICDQAGECGLQEQYMKFGQYDPEMGERKVKKRKVVDLGSKIVLDTERCILCSRCVRFTDEVTKTNELGIFNRGDRSEIGTVEDKPLNNNYAVNTVDICPVGALTSKDFRFQQRVWYLDDKATVCPGCSTGCNVNAFYNDKGYFRLKPKHNEEINSYWMCDEGRALYRHANKDVRLLQAIEKLGDEQQYLAPGAAAKKVSDLMSSVNKDKVAVVVTGQYSNEEYATLFNELLKPKGISNVYHWKNQESEWNDFDDILLRGDRNPNTKGLLSALDAANIKTSWADLEAKLAAGEIDCLLVIGPEIQEYYKDMPEKISLFSKARKLIWFSANPVEGLSADYIIPAKTYLEKNGTIVNYEGREQKIQQMKTIVSEALTLSDLSYLLVGKDIPFAGTAS